MIDNSLLVGFVIVRRDVLVAFRNGQQAVKDAKAACSIIGWNNEHMIDTLAAAYAETGDFGSAIGMQNKLWPSKESRPKAQSFSRNT